MRKLKKARHYDLSINFGISAVEQGVFLESYLLERESLYVNIFED